MPSKFSSTHPHYEFLRKKWVQKKKNQTEKFFDKHSDTLRRLTLGGLSGLMLLTTPGLPLGSGQRSQALGQGVELINNNHELSVGIKKEEDKNALLKEALDGKVPSEMRKLTPDEEKQIGDILTNKFGYKITAELEGKKLNRSYGLIGGEQHLYRYPGDNLYKHAKDAQDWAMYGSSGIAPGLGAWGYFAPSEKEFDAKDEERERYYIAVQTFLAPGYAENVKEYSKFFKYRKMILVNPNTGQAVVTVIGDAGPAEWTGKSLGGSPEVMHFIGYAKGPRKGPVLYYFIDDPDDKIPLGPTSIK